MVGLVGELVLVLAFWWCVVSICLHFGWVIGGRLTKRKPECELSYLYERIPYEASNI